MTPVKPHMRKPRIGAVYPFWMSIGGVEVQTLSLIEHSRDWLDWQGVTITDGGQFDPAAVRRLADRGLLAGHPLELAARCDALIVCAYPEAPSWVSQVCCPIIAVSHMDGSNDYNRKHLASIRPHAELTVGVSSAAVRDLPEIPGQSIAVINNGFDLNRIATTLSRQRQRALLGFGDQHRLVGYIGRISEEKNPLAAAVAVSGLGPEYQAIYVGSGLNEKPWREVAESLAPGRVHWLGALEHVGDILQALDCLVMASPAEAGPIVALEALAAGCPLVATNVGMLPELLDNLRYPSAIELLPNPPYSTDLSAAVEQHIDYGRSRPGQTELTWIAQRVQQLYSARRMAREWSAAIYNMLGRSLDDESRKAA